MYVKMEYPLVLLKKYFPIIFSRAKCPCASYSDRRPGAYISISMLKNSYKLNGWRVSDIISWYHMLLYLNSW